MIIAIMIVATIVDLALAALMIGVSGFIFGAGPESAHGGSLLLAAYVAGVITCPMAPIAGFILNRRGQAGIGVLVAGLPALAAVVMMAIPAPY